MVFYFFVCVQMMFFGDLYADIPQEQALSTKVISGVLKDEQGYGVAGVLIIASHQNGVSQKTQSDITGFFLLRVPFVDGQWSLSVSDLRYDNASLAVRFDDVTTAFEWNVVLKKRLSTNSEASVLKIQAKKLQTTPQQMATSKTSISSQQIEQLPHVGQNAMTKVIATQASGVVEGGFGQLFFRGSHSGYQYVLDGVQLPQVQSGSFLPPFHPRNIQSMEVITGGLPAAYGQRLNAVIDIQSKTGADAKFAEAEIAYGSYAATIPQLFFGTTNASNTWKAYVGAQGFFTHRGLNTPQPISETDLSQGGSESVHNGASGYTLLARVDGQLQAQHLISFLGMFSGAQFEIPNYPQNFDSKSNFFKKKLEACNQGHTGHDATIPFVPSVTDDRQKEASQYGHVAYRYWFSPEGVELQIAPFFRHTTMDVLNDPDHDLASAMQQGPYYIADTRPVSFKMFRRVLDGGLKVDIIAREATHKIESGVLLMMSRAGGDLEIIRTTAAGTFEKSPFVIDSTVISNGVYVQDVWEFLPTWSLSAGIRWDFYTATLAGENFFENMLQPRVGLTKQWGEAFQTRGYYGKLFQPAAPENFRILFSNANSAFEHYDIRAQREDYLELGASYSITPEWTVGLVGYYAVGVNIIDEAQLFNTSLSQPFNFDKGYRYGLDASLKAMFKEHWRVSVVYSYAQAQAKGASGGLWANDHPVSSDYQPLDHVQNHTASASLYYVLDIFWIGLQSNFGSGFFTGAHNQLPIRSHWTWDVALGGIFQLREAWAGVSKVRWSVDVLNILDDAYPITVSNVFNRTQYAPGLQIFGRLGVVF